MRKGVETLRYHLSSRDDTFTCCHRRKASGISRAIHLFNKRELSNYDVSRVKTEVADAGIKDIEGLVAQIKKLVYVLG